MDIQYFVYTRTFGCDYNLVFSPSEALCSSEIRKEFIEEARGTINVEHYVTCLDRPIWLLSKKNDVVLFGVGIYNNCLCDANNTDKLGRGVRGFFGIIAKADQLKSLPMDLNFFKDFYAKYLSPLWKTDRESLKQKGISVVENLDSYHQVFPLDSGIKLNTESYKSVIFGDDVELEELLANALLYQGTISVVGVLQEKAHAFDPKCKFMNCLVVCNSMRQEKQYANTQGRTDLWSGNMMDDVEKEEQNRKKEEQRKKELRLRLVAVVGFLILLAIVLLIVKLVFKK